MTYTEIKTNPMIPSKYIIFILFLLIPGLFLNAQDEINKEVRVVKPYSPTLSDADKINFLPVFNDTTKVYHSFQYEINPKRYSTNFRVNPISPAKMVGLPLKRLYKSQLSLGMGNYFTPFAEITVNQLRDRKRAIGLYAKHHSSGGKVKLENDEKVDAGFSENLVNLYGRQMFSHSVLEGSINGGYNSVLYYGYRPEIDTLLVKDSIRQKFYTAGAKLEYYSANPDSSHLNYKTSLDYNYLVDNYKFHEHGFNLRAEFAGFIGDWYSSIESGFALYDRSSNFDSTNNSVLSLNPSISKATDAWRFLIGLNSSFDTKYGDTRLSIYPRAEFEFNIVENVLIPYMGITGYKEVNSYRSILMENPFVSPGTVVENADYSLVGFFGLRGSYSSRMAFDFRFKYSQVDSMHFFVNSPKDTLMNTFDVEYDDVSLFNVGGEVTWNHNEKLKFILKADYYRYECDQQEYAWNKPSFKTSLNASYNLRKKILVDANLFYTGKRHTLFYTDYSAPGEVVELNPYFDANLSAEYRYTSTMSFFLKLNNLSASRYQEWYQYPVQRFQAMIGFTYAL